LARPFGRLSLRRHLFLHVSSFEQLIRSNPSPSAFPACGACQLFTSCCIASSWRLLHFNCPFTHARGAAPFREFFQLAPVDGPGSRPFRHFLARFYLPFGVLLPAVVWFGSFCFLLGTAPRRAQASHVLFLAPLVVAPLSYPPDLQMLSSKLLRGYSDLSQVLPFSLRWIHLSACLARSLSTRES